MTVLGRYPRSVACLALILCGCVPVVEKPIGNSLIYCSVDAPESMNPQLATTSSTLNATSNHLYNRLLRFNVEQQQMLPELAESWQISDDGLAYTFKLRRDVSFHDTDWFSPTRNFQAADVVHSFQRLIDPQHPLHGLASDGYPFFDSLGLEDYLADVQAIDEYQVRFALHQPHSEFLHLLSSDFSVIHSAEYAEQVIANQPQSRWDTVDLNPIGTGPFKLRYRHRAEWLRLEQHPAYWQQPTQLSELVIDFTQSTSKRLAKLFSGECDVSSVLATRDLALIEAEPELELLRSPGANIAYLAFNTSEPPLQDPAVRRAVAQAIDTQLLVQAIFHGEARRSESLLRMPGLHHPLSTPGLAHNPQSDPAEVAAILASAGYPEGLELTLWLDPAPRVYNPSPGEMAEVLKQQLAKANIRLQIKKRNWTRLVPKLKAGEHHMVLLGWQADTSSTYHLVSSLLSCDAISSGTNASHWCDQRLETLLLRARQSLSTEAIDADWVQAEQLLLEQMPILPIASSERIWAKRVTIQGLELPVIGSMDFSGVTIDKAPPQTVTSGVAPHRD